MKRHLVLLVMTDWTCPNEFLEFALSLVDTSGPVILSHFRTDCNVQAKADNSPVTLADRAAESRIRERIASTYPDHGIFGEEFGIERADSPYVWVIDPIDGTQSFVIGKPTFGTLVALLKDGRPVLGIIDHPALAERWVGAAGHSTQFNGRPVKTRVCAGLDRAWISSTTPLMFHGTSWLAYQRLRDRVHTPHYGADCYAYGLLANGTLDIVVEASMAPYDYCALVPVVEGAGGIITDWEGESLNLLSNGHVLAAGDRSLHAAALEVLKEEAL